MRYSKYFYALIFFMSLIFPFNWSLHKELINGRRDYYFNCVVLFWFLRIKVSDEHWRSPPMNPREQAFLRHAFEEVHSYGDLVLYSHRSELEWRSTSWHRKGRSWTLGHRMISSKKSRTLKQFNNMWRSVKKICFGFPNFNYKFMKRQKSCATWCKKMSNLKNHIIGGTFVPKGIIMMPIYIMTPPLWANLQDTPWPPAHHHTCHPSFQCMMA